MPAEMPTAKIKDTTNNADELSSGVDIAPSGICKVIRVSMHKTRHTLAHIIINKDRPA